MRLPVVFRSVSIVVFMSPWVALLSPTGWAGEDADAAVAQEDSIAGPSAARTGGPQTMESKSAQALRPLAETYQPSSEQLALEPALRERVKQRWDALLQRDFKAAYRFETPAYRREHTEKEFSSEFGSMVVWHVATVKELRYDRPQEAEVLIALDYSFPMPSGNDARTTGFFRETWVFLDGEWWRRNDRQPLGGGK